jgi:putative cardiolipin synthase
MSMSRIFVWRFTSTGRAAPGRTGLLPALLACALLLLSGCAGLPHVDRTRNFEQSAIPMSDKTTLGRIAAVSQPAPLLSGFRLMPLGAFSLDTRLQLARRAEVSLDVQYYDFENDETGRLLLRALRDAANRGVRVRLFLDDFYTSGNDWFFLAFAAHPNVEVRLFNPFCCARDQGQLSRFVAAGSDFSRVNHRMHNKLFVADGAMAVIGGRNIANEYFLRGMSGNFVDVDAFTTGFIVAPLAGLFDRYWNSVASYPLEKVARTTLSKAELQARFEAWTGAENTPPTMELPTNDILGYGPIADDLDLGRLGLIWGDAYVFADHPDKPFDDQSNGELLETSVTYNVFEAIRSAKSEVLASSPYFVPGKRGMEMLRGLRERGVNVTILTNSLATTDEFLVHTGYSRYREDLLRMGVNLYELSTSRLMQNKRAFLFGASLGRLHAKLAVVDRRLSFIGSMNLDPRSAVVNTELGAIVDSPELAKELIRVIDLDRLHSAYRVRLSQQNGKLEWISGDGDKDLILDTEPEATPLLRFKAWLLNPWIPEELL